MTYEEKNAAFKDIQGRDIRRWGAQRAIVKRMGRYTRRAIVSIFFYNVLKTYMVSSNTRWLLMCYYSMYNDVLIYKANVRVAQVKAVIIGYYTCFFRLNCMRCTPVHHQQLSPDVHAHSAGTMSRSVACVNTTS